MSEANAGSRRSSETSRDVVPQFLQAFDVDDGRAPCPLRTQTVTAPQALFISGRTVSFEYSRLRRIGCDPLASRSRVDGLRHGGYRDHRLRTGHPEPVPSFSAGPEFSFVAPEGVEDARQFARQGDGRRSTAPAFADLRCPELERSRIRAAATDLQDPSSLD